MKPPHDRMAAAFLSNSCAPRSLEAGRQDRPLAQGGRSLTELRRWFNHEPDKWTEFKRRYYMELRARGGSLEPILESVRAGPVTFVFASRELRFNNAVALREYMERAT